MDMRSHLQGRETTRREQNANSPYWHKWTGDSTRRTTRQVEENRTIRGRTFKFSLIFNLHASLECLAKDERPNRPELVIVQNSGHVDDDIHFSAFDVLYEKDGVKSRYIKEVLDWYREEDAADLAGNELD